MAEEHAGRRRIDRVAAPDLLDGVADQPAEVLRALRDECQEEETRLSYARRVVQGRLDVARMELERRGAEGGADASEAPEDDRALVERLASALADQPSSSPREARTMSFYQPVDEPDRRDDDLAKVPALGSIPDLDDEGIAEVIAQLQVQEAELSRARRAVLDNLDGLQAELVRRYREGSADVGAILSAARPREREDGGR